jgi:hypothetical protein
MRIRIKIEQLKNSILFILNLYFYFSSGIVVVEWLASEASNSKVRSSNLGKRT